MKKKRVGINGFGRIGRAIFRINLLKKYFDVVAINDLGTNTANLAYMLKYDSIHGVLREDVEFIHQASTDKDWTTNEIRVGNEPIKVFSESKNFDVPWNELGVDVVIDASGNVQNLENADKCLGLSVKKIIFTNSPSAGVDFTLVLGVNDHKYDKKKHRIIAASICDVVGMSPAVKVIEEKFGIESGFITTLHPWLSYQNLLDGRPSTVEFKEKPGIYDDSTHHVMGRASINALIPKKTSAVHAMEIVLPEIKGKIESMSYRVPTDVVTTGIVILRIKEKTNVTTLKDLFRTSSKEPFMLYTEEPRISVDYKHCDTSCIIDGKWIDVVDERLIRFTAWYDNEWGYSARVVDAVNFL